MRFQAPLIRLCERLRVATVPKKYQKWPRLSTVFSQYTRATILGNRNSPNGARWPGLNRKEIRLRETLYAPPHPYDSHDLACPVPDIAGIHSENKVESYLNKLV